MAIHHQKFCSDCRCTLVKLHDFDGTSSFHGQYVGSGDAEHYRHLGMGALVFDLVGGIIHALRRRKRRRKVEELKAETLQIFPDSVICPKCLQVTSRM